MENSSKITLSIDNDAGLQTKRKLLTVASLILLVLSFSGATIEEANTFIFKIKFVNQNGLGILLVLAIVFLMIRYYNYAKPYHDQLYRLWASRLLQHRFFSIQGNFDPEDRGVPNIVGGLVIDSLSDKICSRNNEQGYNWTASYKRKWLFRRYIYFECYSQEDYYISYDSINIFIKFGLSKYLNAICLELIQLGLDFFIHRENLDILTPYMIGILAIVSYYFNAELLNILLFLTPSKNN